MAVPAQDLTSTGDKLRFIFDIYDTDGNGQIDRTELQESLRNEIESTGIHITEEKLHHLTASLFDKADGDGDGGITFEEFRTELEKYPDVVDTLTSSMANKLPAKPSSRFKPFRFILNNKQLAIFLIMYFCCNAAFFARRAYVIYYDTPGPPINQWNPWYVLARACGHTLNFNGIVVLILMLRKTLSYCRPSPLYYILPFDHTVDLHKFVGVVIAFLAFGHTVGHVGNGVGYAMTYFNCTPAELMFTKPDCTPLGTIEGSAFITGWLLNGFMIVILLGAMSCVRNSGHFQVFRWIHFVCYMSIFALYLMHGPHFWKWFVAPAVIYVIEKISQLPIVKTFRHGSTFIKEAKLLPSGVTQLVITRPDTLQYRPGDYIFILIPAIAKYEWHPFTLSSAPEQPDLQIHVQTRGTWTRRLYSYFNNLGLRSRTQREKDQNVKRFEKLAIRLSTTDDEESHREVKPRGMSMIFDLKSNQKMRIIDEPDGIRKMMKVGLTYQLPVTRHCAHIHKYPHLAKDRVFIQGPYGTPSTSTFTADHAVLIGGGIGVTPFASIIQSIVCKYRRYQHKCPNCDHKWANDIPQNMLKMKKVDFIWINRNPTAFEWFVKMLSELEEEEHESSLGHFFDIHLFMTAMRSDDVKSLALQLALEAVHAKDQKDVFTGLRTKLQLGRPDFDKLFKNFKDQRKGKVEIFFCGSTLLGKTVKAHAQKYGFLFHTEVF